MPLMPPTIADNSDIVGNYVSLHGYANLPHLLCIKELWLDFQNGGY